MTIHKFDEKYQELIKNLNNICQLLCSNKQEKLKNTNIDDIKNGDNEVVEKYISTLIELYAHQCKLHNNDIPYASFNFLSLIESRFRDYDKIIEDCTHMILSSNNPKKPNTTLLNDILYSIKFNKIKHQLEDLCEKYNTIYSTITEDETFNLTNDIILLVNELNKLDHTKYFDKKKVIMVFSPLIEKYVNRNKIISIFFEFYPISKIQKISNNILMCMSKSNKRIFITTLFIAINQTASKLSLQAIQNLVYEDFSKNLHVFYKLEGLFKAIYSTIDDETNIMYKHNIQEIINIIIYRENCYNRYKVDKLSSLFSSLSNREDYCKAITFSKDAAVNNKENILTSAITIDENFNNYLLSEDSKNLAYQTKLKEKFNKYLSSLSNNISIIAADKLEICFIILNCNFEIEKINSIKAEIIATTLFIYNKCERNINITEQYINHEVISRLKEIDSSFIHEVFTILKILNPDDSIYDITFSVLFNEVSNMINLCNAIWDNIKNDITLNTNTLDEIEKNTNLNIKHSHVINEQYNFLIDSCDHLNTITSTNLKSIIEKMNIHNKFTTLDSMRRKIIELNQPSTTMISSPHNTLTYSYNSSINYLSPQPRELTFSESKRIMSESSSPKIEL